MLSKHLRILVRTRCGRHAIDHASLLLGAPGRGIHRCLSNIVPGHLVLHQSLLQVLKRGPVCLFLSDVWMFSPDLVLNLYELSLYLWRELSRLLWHARRAR
ncbi:Chromatin modification-related protein EAF1 [Cytospora mali]|uniref:Chromatin modification-related protein EAF1 n=1 Tax=Cytospora mali TaxID=578113 RepID=A0A194VMP7_CYTMA|nr:Chromatin modification-related protein EAF1 [Valsa mali]